MKFGLFFRNVCQINHKKYREKKYEHKMKFHSFRNKKEKKYLDYDWFCMLFLVCKTARKYSASFSGATRWPKTELKWMIFCISCLLQELCSSLKYFSAFYLWNSKFCHCDCSIAKLFLVILPCSGQKWLKASFGRKKKKDSMTTMWTRWRSYHSSHSFHPETLSKKSAALNM